MLYDGITLAESSVIENLNVASGANLPVGTVGELFYQDGVGLLLHNGSTWELVGGGGHAPVIEAIKIAAAGSSDSVGGASTVSIGAQIPNTNNVWAAGQYTFATSGAQKGTVFVVNADGTKSVYAQPNESLSGETTFNRILAPLFDGGITLLQTVIGGVPNANGPFTLANGDSSAIMHNGASLSSVLSGVAPTDSPTFTGTVSGITKAMVGLGSVDNTSDANKPVSTATQDALDLKAPLASPSFTGTVSGITKAMVGLGSVDNTSDANKPVSTATQTELNKKQNTLVSGTSIKTINGASLLGAGDISGVVTQTGSETLTNKTLTAPVISGLTDMNGNLDVDGNINLSGNARRITGDFSNATVGNRTLFQTRVVNGATDLTIVPNGTSTYAAVSARSSDSSNASVAALVVNGSSGKVEVASTITGIAPFLPLTFSTAGAERLHISTDGNVGVGTQAPNVKFVVSGPNAGLAAGSVQELMRMGDSRDGAAQDAIRLYAVRETTATNTGDWFTQTLRLERSIDSEAQLSGIDFAPSGLKFRVNGFERVGIEEDGNTIFRAGVQETLIKANTGAAYTIYLGSGTIFDLILTANCTFTFPTPTAGKQFTLLYRQDGTGSRTVTWPSNVRWDDGGTAPTPTATAWRTDVFTFLADGTFWIGFKGPKNYNRS